MAEGTKAAGGADITWEDNEFIDIRIIAIRKKNYWKVDMFEKKEGAYAPIVVTIAGSVGNLDMNKFAPGGAGAAEPKIMSKSTIMLSKGAANPKAMEQVTQFFAIEAERSKKIEQAVDKFCLETGFYTEDKKLKEADPGKPGQMRPLRRAYAIHTM